MTSKLQILTVYKSLMRESQKFPNFNFRAYALRRVRDAFKENKNMSDPKIIKKEYEFAKQNLQVVKRQVIVGDLYKTDKLVIENVQ